MEVSLVRVLQEQIPHGSYRRALEIHLGETRSHADRHDVAKTGAADAVRDAAQETKAAARGAKRATRQARRVPGVARAEGAAKGAVASEEDLPIQEYDELTAEEIVARLRDGDDALAAGVRDYERAHKNRATVRAAERELSHA